MLELNYCVQHAVERQLNNITVSCIVAMYF